MTIQKEAFFDMLLPVESKQIAFCSYNEDEATLHLYYHTGEIVAYPSVDKEAYRAVLESTNRYDTLMDVTQKVQAAGANHVEWSGTGAAAAWQDI